MQLSLEVNFLAVIVGGVLYMIVGALWYSPMLFGNYWMKQIGKTVEEIQQSSPLEYGYAFVAALLSTFMLAVFMKALGAATLTDGLMAGGLVWLGFVATTTLTYTIFEGPPKTVWMLYQGYQLLMLLIVGGLLGAWQ